MWITRLPPSREGVLIASEMDRTFRSVVFTPALVWLFGRGHRLIGEAPWRASLDHMDRLPDGSLHVRLRVASLTDRALLALSTRSCSGSEMPGPLDHAFEAALPGGEWPLFSFAVDQQPTEWAG